MKATKRNNPRIGSFNNNPYKTTKCYFFREFKFENHCPIKV